MIWVHECGTKGEDLRAPLFPVNFRLGSVASGFDRYIVTALSGFSGFEYFPVSPVSSFSGFEGPPTPDQFLKGFVPFCTCGPRPGGGPFLKLYGANFLTLRPGGGPVLRPYGANFLIPQKREEFSIANF